MIISLLITINSFPLLYTLAQNTLKNVNASIEKEIAPGNQGNNNEHLTY